MKRKLNGPTKSNLSITTKKTLIIFIVFTLFFTISSLAPAEPVLELDHFGDFSIALVELERKEDTAILHLAVTKVADTDSAPDLVPVSLIDDHMNEYSQSFIIDLEGEPATLSALPEGFCYVKTVTIPIPKIAPIKKVKVGEKGVNFGDIKLGKPRYLKEYGSTAVTKGQKVQVGKWMSFTMSKIEPALRQWELLVDVENKEYNPLLAEVKVGAQHENGTISWTSSQFDMPAASKFFKKLPLPIPSWTDKGLPYPRALLLLYRDKKSGEQALKIYAMATDELPTLVGQGPKEIEDKFIDSYQRNGGRKTIGDPLGLPHWFAGGNQPKDSRDLLVQEFPSVSQFGRSVILWDAQKDLDKAYVIHGEVWDTYLNLGGPEHWLGYPIGNVSISTKGHPIVGFEGGYIGTPNGVTFESYKYPTGKIVYQRGSMSMRESGIYIINADGTGQEKISNDDRPVWSPDGTKIAFVSRDSNHISIMNADGSNIRVLIEAGSWSLEKFGSVDWSPDGRHLVFSKGYLGESTNEIWRMNADGSSLLKLTSWKGRGGNPFWSPDGMTIAFERSDRIDRQGFIYLMDSEGGNERILTAGSLPLWSPDGSKIVFIPNTNPRDIYVIDKDGINSTLLMTHSEPIYSVSYSPDSKWFAFSAGSYNPHIYLFGPGNCLFQLKTEGNATNPSWSSQLNLRKEVLEKGIMSPVDTPKIEPSLQKVKLLSPQNGSTLLLGDVTFSWNPVSNATKYQFILYNRQGQVALDTTKDTTSLTISLAGGEGTITWKVRAGDNSGNWGTWSSLWSLTLKFATTISSESSPQISETTYSLTGSLHCPDKRGYPCNSCSSASGYINHFKGFNVLTTNEDCYVKLIYNNGAYIGNQNNCEVTIKGEKWLGLENESGAKLVEEINKGNFDFKRANKFIERTMNFPGDNYKYEFANEGKEFRLYLPRNREEAFKAVPWKNITVEIKNKETDKVFKYKFQKGIFPQAYSWSNGVANYGQCVWWTAKRWVEEVDSKTLFSFYPPSPQGVNVIKIDSNYQPKKFDILIDYDPRQTGELGHYGFVEKIEGDKMYISQFNWIKPGEVYNHVLRAWKGKASDLYYSNNPNEKYYFKYYYRK